MTKAQLKSIASADCSAARRRLAAQAFAINRAGAYVVVKLAGGKWTGRVVGHVPRAPHMDGRVLVELTYINKNAWGVNHIDPETEILTAPILHTNDVPTVSVTKPGRMVHARLEDVRLLPEDWAP